MNRVFYKSCEDMSEIADGTVQTCVTSPPYFGLRDYGTASWHGGDPACNHKGDQRYYTEKTAAGSSSEAFSEAGEVNAERLRKGRWREGGTCQCGAVYRDEQIGLEPTLDAYIERLVRVFREVKRVLRDDGTLWLNLGDSYAGSWGARGRGDINGAGTLAAQQIAAAQRKVSHTGTIRDPGLKPKDLIGVPWAVALALRADGWWLRSDIVWFKQPCMPESIEDRPTRAHEFIFLLSKQSRYYYDADAIREPLAESSLERLAQNIEARIGIDRIPGKTNGPMKAVSKWPKRKDSGAALRSGLGGIRESNIAEPGRANKRDVWKISPAQYSEAHLATFPPEIPSLCIRAGSKPSDLVLDPFAGSGTTLEVAESLGRAWVGYELNEGYRPLIEARLRQRGLFTTESA